MYYYIDPNGRIHALDDPKYDYLLPEGCEAMPEDVALELASEPVHI